MHFHFLFGHSNLITSENVFLKVLYFQNKYFHLYFRLSFSNEWRKMFLKSERNETTLVFTFNRFTNATYGTSSRFSLLESLIS